MFEDERPLEKGLDNDGLSLICFHIDHDTNTVSVIGSLGCSGVEHIEHLFFLLKSCKKVLNILGNVKLKAILSIRARKLLIFNDLFGFLVYFTYLCTQIIR